MRALLRNLARQPWRTTLTVLGVAIGIFALVVFGALAEHFRAIVDDSKDFVRGTIRLATKTNPQGVNPGINKEDLETARAVPGVHAIAPSLLLLLDGYNLEGDPLIFLTPKALVEGLPPDLAERMRPGVHLVEGRWIRASDEPEVIIVRWLAQRRSWHIGDLVPVRHVSHRVVGIFEAPDVSLVPAAIVPYASLNTRFQHANVEEAIRFFTRSELQVKQLEAFAERFVVEQGERYYTFEVVPTDLGKVHDIASALKQKLPHVAVIEPDALAAQMEKAVAIFLAITGVVSVISSLVGGLLIVNTMAMAVVERRREVAIKVAIGASTGQVASEFVFEAGIIGLAGAALGVAAGILAIALLDPWIVAKVEVGASLFKLTPGLLLGAIGFGVGLGIVAGLVPAWRAARQDPAQGLREL